MNNMNTNYKDIITSFMLSTVLQYVGMPWMIETHEQFKYDMVKHNLDWITGGPWYNTSIFLNYMGQCLKNILEMQEVIDTLHSFKINIRAL